MDSVPSILSSAQSLVARALSPPNRSAPQFTARNADMPNRDLSPGIRDPFLGNFFDRYSSREDVSAGIALLNTSARLSADLFQSLDRYDPTNPAASRPSFDRYA